MEKFLVKKIGPQRVKRLPPKYLAPLSDVITECSQSINPYDILKRALISRYTLSEDAQLDKLHKIQFE